MVSSPAHRPLRRLLFAPTLVAAALLLAPAAARADSPPAAVPPPLAFQLGVPLVRILADRPGVALYHVRTSTPWCVAPCNLRLDGRDGSVVYFGGPGIRPSEPFTLERMIGETRFRVQTGSRS